MNSAIESGYKPVIRRGETRLIVDKLNEFPDSEIESQLTLNPKGEDWNSIATWLENSLHNISQGYKFIPEIRLIPPKVKIFYKEKTDRSHTFRINYSPTEGTEKFIHKWKTLPQLSNEASNELSAWGVKIRKEKKTDALTVGNNELPADLSDFDMVSSIYQLRRKWVIQSPSGRYYNIALGGNWAIDPSQIEWRDPNYEPQGEPKIKIEVEYKGIERATLLDSDVNLESIIYEISSINQIIKNEAVSSGMEYPFIKPGQKEEID